MLNDGVNLFHRITSEKNVSSKIFSRHRQDSSTQQICCDKIRRRCRHAYDLSLPKFKMLADDITV